MLRSVLVVLGVPQCQRVIADRDAEAGWLQFFGDIDDRVQRAVRHSPEL